MRKRDNTSIEQVTAYMQDKSRDALLLLTSRLFDLHTRAAEIYNTHFLFRWINVIWLQEPRSLY